ncbi:hypothetical protein ACG873_00170 (plasmid) [Mesorhizobium sp. AaZ16]|uniref:hypothetical protein n=1 Tax=Mesorhizobium sp. AaZ16 TaxID=3402289 RepID=UPI00374E6E67
MAAKRLSIAASLAFALALRWNAFEIAENGQFGGRRQEAAGLQRAPYWSVRRLKLHPEGGHQNKAGKTATLRSIWTPRIQLRRAWSPATKPA